MKYLLGAAALLAATVSADLCADGSTDDNGNYYCQEVTAITYNGVGGSASYNLVTDMDSSTGSCSSTPFAYSGNLAPLDEEVSLHFRGPLILKQLAVYMPGSSASKARRGTFDHRHAHGNAHAHMHHRRHAAHVEERQVGAEVVATMNGQVVSWVNEYSGQTTVAAAAAAATASAAASSSGSGSSSSSSGTFGSQNVASGWARQAYYNSESGTSQGLVFLNHEGGSGSGVFDYTFGNSLSYASSDGASGASSSQILADTTLASSTEVVVMTDLECGAENGDCGYYREGTVAYHGFNGSSKAFFVEFGMPSTGQTTASEYVPVNMPAIWMLNALIPRTLQYGNADCSCWTTGCGEFDIFEVLAPGDTRAKSTLHGNIAGGDSDYFSRPVTGTAKAAVIMNDNSIHIKMLDDSVEFGPSLSTDDLNSLIDSTLTQTNGVSLFNLSG